MIKSYLCVYQKKLLQTNAILFNPIEASFFGNLVNKIRHRKVDEEAKQGKKVCVPFANRTYVRANGQLQFCERIESYGLVNNDTKYLHQASFTLHNEFKLMKESDCSKCFAYNFCEMCPASFITDGQLDYSKSIAKCNQFRDAVKNNKILHKSKVKVMNSSFELKIKSLTSGKS